MNKTIFLVILFSSLFFVATSQQVCATGPVSTALAAEELSPKVGIKKIDSKKASRIETIAPTKQKPLVNFSSVEIKRIYSGKWVWEVKLKRGGSSYVPANTARLIVTQSLSNGKSLTLANDTYDKVIKNTGLLIDDFVPSSDEDTLSFTLQETRFTDGGLHSVPHTVGTRVIKMPLENLSLMTAGYAWTPPNENNPYLYAHFNNKMSWPIRVRLRMVAGDLGHWLDERFNREVPLPVGEFTQKEHWKYTAKGAGYWKVIVEMQYLNPDTMETYWKEIDSKKGNLPTN